MRAVVRAGVICLLSFLGAGCLALPSATDAASRAAATTPAPRTTAATTPAPRTTATARTHTVRLPARARSNHLAALRFWTVERMRQAVPFDRLVRLVPRPRVKPKAVASGAPRLVRPTSARWNRWKLPPWLDDPSESHGRPWTGSGAITRTAGRVFFTFQGRLASCSGDAVTSENASVVVTAGHCVKYQGAWHTNWMFVPGYHDGKRPFGSWAARELLTTPQWEAEEDINYDVGMAVVNRVRGRTLTDVVGGAGIAFNQARGGPVYAFGYPAAAPYDGSKLIYCNGPTFNDPLVSQDQGLRCDMTGGASGGPWLLRFDPKTGTGVQNSVNSFKYNFAPYWMFGPYFGDEVQRLYDRAQSA